MLKELIKIANELDKRSLRVEADKLDSIILKFAEDNFDDENFIEPEELESSNSSQIVSDAIERSIGMPHYEATFLTRNPGDEAEGSVFLEAQTSDSLKAAVWQPFGHEDIKAPAQGYEANIPGTFGLVELKNLDSEVPIKMVLGHKGEEPFVTALVDKSNVSRELTEKDFTVILLGPGEDGLIVWTFFPGPPIAPSSTTPSEKTDSVRTVADAIAIGFDYAKVATLSE
tara:strand:- start:901 stop:1584 length:684 start_codon:yes stop_codon:yes gene_type:complete